VKALLFLLIIGTCVVEIIMTRNKKQLNKCCQEIMLCERDRKRVLPHGFLGDVIVVKGMHTLGGVY
jgi:hypothetical protein